jgi:CRP/FNR family transcriptional regulator, cyclic AMP receptor protein
MNGSYCEEFENHAVFGALDSFSLERLLQVGRSDELRRHETLFSEGDRAERVYVILNGAIKVTSEASNHREVILDVLGGTDLVGEEAIGSDRRSTTALAMTDTLVMGFPAAAIRTLWSRNPEFAMAWAKYLAASRSKIQQRITELSYGTIEDRLYRVLLHLARPDESGHKPDASATKKGILTLKYKLTHQEFANLIGATRETTTLAVGRLKSTGAVQILDGKILVRDTARSDTHLEEKLG